jgi:hypothetical protein
MQSLHRSVIAIATTLGALGCGKPLTPLLAHDYALDFGTVVVGATSERSLSLTNQSSSPVTLLSIGAPSDAEFVVTQSAPVSIAAGATLQLPFTFAPSSNGLKRAIAVLQADAPEIATATVALTGTGAVGCLHAMPTSLDFGEVVFGSAVTVRAGVTNCSEVAVTVTPSIAGPEAAQFTAVAPASTIVLASDPDGNSPVEFLITYAPDAPAGQTSQSSATLEVLGAIDGSPQFASVSVPLTGTGTRSGLQISPDPVPACTAAVGQSAEIDLSLQNDADESIIVYDVALQGAGPFAFAPPGSPASTDGPAVTLAPYSSLPVTLLFSPQSAGSYSDSLQIVDDHGDNIALPLSCQASP